MLSHRHAVISGVFAALLSSNSFAALDSAGQALLQQGRYWQEHDDTARATEVWNKLLLIDPQQADALHGLGMLGVTTKRPAQAEQYLQLMRKFHPDAPLTLQLEQAINLQGDSNEQLLDQIQMAMASDEQDKAISLYRQLFAGKPPQGELGLRYYSYLGYSKDGQKEARQGLERLLQQTPNNPRIKLALARILTLDESTRIEGIKRLAQLSTVQELGGEATESWRQALLWMGSAGAVEGPLYESYLKAYPDDSEVREHLNTLRSEGVAAENSNLSRAFKALQNNQLGVAEQAFLTRLKDEPQDSDALGGLGLVRQKQGRTNDANELLKRAAAGGKNARWQAALDSNRYWDLLTQASRARAEQDLQGARRLLQQAIASKPRQVEGYVALGGVQADLDQLDSAEASYRQALTLDADNPDALAGLVTVLSQGGKASQGLRLIEGLNADQQKRIGDLRPLRAAVAVGQAKNAERSGDLKGAVVAQQDAVRNDPQDPWVSFDLARLYVLTDAPDKARQTVAELVKNNPQKPEALYVSALISSQLGEWSAAQTTLDRIPAGQRSSAMQQLAKDVQVQALISQASTLTKQGNRAQALSVLRQAELNVGGKPDLLSAVAGGFADAGDTDHGLAILRSAIAQSSSPSPALQLAYAGILLKTGDDVQVNQILRDLRNQKLQASEQRSYDDLLFLYTVRQADLLREKGDLVAAYDTLAPALAQRPDDALAVASLARMFLANNDAKKAIELYKPLLAKKPQDPELQIGMAQALNKSGDYRGAEAAIDKALALAPNNPQILATAASLYRAQGKNAKASELYSRALALQEPVKKADANPFAGVVAANPFVGARGQRSESRLSESSINQIPEPAEVQVAAAEETAAAPVASNGRTFNQTAAYSQLSPRTDGNGRVLPGKSTADSPDPRQSMQRALDQIQQERSPRVTQGVTYRGNDSESGLSKMTEVQTPLEISWPLDDNRIALRVTPVWLNAGSVGSDSENRFGSGPAIPGAQLTSGLSATDAANLQTALNASPGSAVLNSLAGSTGGSIGRQQDNGIGLALAYENPSLGLKTDLGTSPMGFLYSTVVGGISLDRSFTDGSDFRYGISLSRRSVTDSLASFAGAEDRRSGLKWGGVTANGGRLQLGYDDGDVGAYGYGSVHKLVGNNVESNSRLEGGTGVYWYLQNNDSKQLTAGLSLTGISYDKNQSNFTYGNGGYFSPQNFFAIGVPVSWSQRTDRLSYSLRGSVGLQHIEQDAAPYFPNDNALQAALEQVSQVYAASGISVPTQYSGQNKTGVGYNFGANAEYRFGSNFFMGGNFGIDNARDYKQFTGGLYLRYMFDDFNGQMALPVSPYRSPYSN
ncbi:cellulose biosynthesis protein BcsC [Pseudomonas viridiflava]|uniref:cellulose biosynthesis protein BcsC n=1 Tax=Pseudomonas viridiflava TaxID=33069 RepID=UPI000F05B392|nr:cellulose biosynthesis protein BcsC [Pseudomonas viridiflava]